MPKEPNKNVATQTTEEEFDRSICMSYFGNYRTSVKRIENKYGKELAYDVQSAIIDYGLYGIRPVDEDLLIFVSETVFDVIDKSQEKRARGFSGEDLEMSKKIIQSHCDRPDLSQDKLAQLLHISKGKVNKTLKKYRNGEYDGILNFNDVSVSVNANGSDCDNDSTDRDRDRSTNQSIESASPQTESLTPSLPSQITKEDIDKQNKEIIAKWERSKKVIDMWTTHKYKPKDIAEELNYQIDEVNDIINEFNKNKYAFPNKPKLLKFLDITLSNGEKYWQTKQELFNSITNNGKASVDDINWGLVETIFKDDGMPMEDAIKYANEIKTKLKDIQDVTVLQRASNN